MSGDQLRLFEVPDEAGHEDHALHLELMARLPGPGHEVTILAMVDTLLDRLSRDGLFPSWVKVQADVDGIDPDDFREAGVGDF